MTEKTDLPALIARVGPRETVNRSCYDCSVYSGREELGRILNRTCAPAHKYAQEYSVGHVGEDVVAVVVRDARALRARLARYEAVVAEMRVRRDWLDGQCRSVGADSERRRGHVEVYETMRRWIDTALRALDEDSGGSGASPAAVADAEPTPEPAGIVPCVIGPPLRFDGRGAFDVEPDPQAPATRAELEELRREVEDIRRNLRYITGLMPEAG